MTKSLIRTNSRAAQSRAARGQGRPGTMAEWDKMETTAIAGSAEARKLSGVDTNVAFAAGTEAPWHGFSKPVTGQDVDEWLNAADANWEVELRKIRVVDGQVIPGRFAVCRTDTGAPLSTCGTGWHPFQNRQVLDFFQKYCEAGHMTMETVGVLHGGRYVWGLARVGDEFRVGREDVVKGFVLFMNPHNAGEAGVIKHVALRTECQNSLGRGLGEDGVEVRIPHNLVFDAAMAKKAERTLKLSQESLQTFAKQAEQMSEFRISDAQADQYFKMVFKLGEHKDAKVLADAIANTAPVERGLSLEDVITATETPEQTQARTSPVLVKVRESLLTAPGAQFDGSQGTLWGALNAVTHVVDHKLGQDADRRLRNAWFGYRADQKVRAVDVAMAVVNGEVKLAA